jgi:hypothetical protein
MIRFYQRLTLTILYFILYSSYDHVVVVVVVSSFEQPQPQQPQQQHVGFEQWISDAPYEIIVPQTL